MGELDHSLILRHLPFGNHPIGIGNDPNEVQLRSSFCHSRMRHNCNDLGAKRSWVLDRQNTIDLIASAIRYHCIFVGESINHVIIAVNSSASCFTLQKCPGKNRIAVDYLDNCGITFSDFKNSIQTAIRSPLKRGQLRRGTCDAVCQIPLPHRNIIDDRPIFISNAQRTPGLSAVTAAIELVPFKRLTLFGGVERIIFTAIVPD